MKIQYSKCDICGTKGEFGSFFSLLCPIKERPEGASGGELAVRVSLTWIDWESRMPDLCDRCKEQLQNVFTEILREMIG